MVPGEKITHYWLLLFLSAIAVGRAVGSAQEPGTPNQQSPLQIQPLPHASESGSEAGATSEAGAPKSSGNTGLALPQNPSSPASMEMLLPDEILLNPATPVPPDAGMQPSRQALTPQKLPGPPVKIEPILPPFPSQFGGGNSLASMIRVHVNGFRFIGNHVYSNRALQKVVAKYAGRDLMSTELEEARQALTLKYVDAGYINSGAILPDQDLKHGVVIFKIVEGRLTKIELKGNWWLRPWWLRNALRQSAGNPLNFNRLKTGLQILRQDPNIRQINAELEPGGQPGESILKAEVKENEPFHLGIEFSNKRPPSVGAEIMEVHASDLNLTGHSDPLAITWGLAHSSSDTIDNWEYSGDKNIAGSYEFPVTPWKTTMEVHASKSDSAIVEEPFTTLNIKSNSIQYGATLRQPFYESLNNLFAGSITADWRKSETFLLGRPFDLSPGAVDGLTQVFVLRIALEYVNRSQQHVLALRSTFNVGLDAFGASRQDQVSPPSGSGQFVQKIPDGRFFAWLGQAQYVQRLFDTDNLAVLRVDAQLSNDPLVSLEQFSIGGAASVRGYRENQLLRDNGVLASVEIRTPIWRNKEKNAIVTLAPFFDYGAGWDTVRYIGPQPSDVNDNFQWISSVGIGLIVTPSKYVTGQLYWGYALNPSNTVKNGNNLQDYGLHFTLTVNAF
jgi:hemolysin activation/secretion protein